MAKTPKRPRDPNQLAKLIVDHATMDEADLKRFQAERAKSVPKPGQKGKPG